MNKYLIYPVRATIRGLLLIITVSIFILTYIISLIFTKHTKERAFNLRRNWVKLGVIILGIRMEVKGEPYDGAALYTCNHRSFSDPLISSIFIDTFVIAKAEVGSFPVISKGAELTGVIYVKRENKASRTATRDAMVNTIKSGYSVLVFPEGTVSTTPLAMPFKKGTFIEAAKNNFTIVPMALEYKDELDLWYDSNFVSQLFRQFGKRKTFIKFEIGPPMTGEDGIALSEAAESWTNNKIIEMNTGWSNMFSYS